MLFLVAVVLPAAALSVLTFRYLHQDEEMARRLEPGQKFDAVDQVQRGLTDSRSRTDTGCSRDPGALTHSRQYT